ncbi:hypothetical protein [uncultured Methanobrevibacter sp.]|uniref:hypothetical protein n=1 Tax=uncultured Methanobrevibacter sp. TaxID=253161 RepID=UPI0025D5348B|nr:hypothetical protein [uncultured Methanobrevibacter sp.]MDO5810806.1 hypothetical protein [Methanobrevibacter sp.]
MNLNKWILGLLVVFILTAGTSVIFAEQVKVSDISFDVPGNYSVDKTTDDSCVLKNNLSSNYTISIVLTNSSDAIVEKHSRQASGFSFLSEENYTSANNLSVNQQNFVKNESYFSFYTFDVDSSSYMVIYTFPVHDDELSDHVSPVNDIIDSIQ